MRSTLRSTAGIRSSSQPCACSASTASIAALWAATPWTSSTAYSETGGSARCTRSASVVSGSRPRCSDSKRTSSARLRALWRADTSARHAAEVGPVAGVDLDLLARGDEERDGDLGAGLELGRLRAAGRPVALQARLGVLDDELDRGRKLDVERRALVDGDHRLLVLQEIVGVLPDRRR